MSISHWRWRLSSPYELGRSSYYNLRYGIGNLVSWFPVIWRTRPWDHVFLTRVMQKQLRSMIALQRNGTRHTEWYQCALEMETLDLCLQYLEADEIPDYPRDIPYEELHAIHMKHMERMDLYSRIAGEMIATRLRGWWD